MAADDWLGSRLQLRPFRFIALHERHGKSNPFSLRNTAALEGSLTPSKSASGDHLKISVNPFAFDHSNTFENLGEHPRMKALSTTGSPET